MFFCNNNITTGDDNVVMAGTSIYVAYSTFGLGHGCSISSITQNGVSGVTVDHVTFNGTTAGVRMKSARDRGGLVQNLTCTNLTMTNVQTPVTIISYYPTLPDRSDRRHRHGRHRDHARLAEHHDQERDCHRGNQCRGPLGPA